jgi:hypothetical protein
MGTNANKFVVYTSAVAVLGAANNIGFRGNCEIDGTIPACHLIGTEPLHTHDRHTPNFPYGTATSTVSTGNPHIISAIPGAMNFTGTTATIANISASGVSASAATFDLQARIQNPPA